MLLRNNDFRDHFQVDAGCDPVGSMLFFMSRQTFESPIEVVFGIREESLRIPFVKTSPIAIRTGVLEEAGVYLILVILQLRYLGFPSEYFEAWLNIYPSDDFGGELFRILCQQRRLVLQFFGESGQIERILTLPNNIAQWLALNLTLDPQRSWAMEEFDWAREQVYTRFPTPKELFFHLERPQVKKVSSKRHNGSR